MRMESVKLWETVWQVLTKLKSSNTSPKMYPKEIKHISTQRLVHVFLEALYMRELNQKQPKCLLTYARQTT